ncbi:MFS general substrate transporter [Rhizodiscina lignyota]|uniref:MFS general substrate transporter n=1 Tax=Rhizodiscina lignyota TaxID=1504668 RepID=A0A9P4ICB0_9PEZI|nr:MFS general substrate transporter [Rhizodiscina lignyota]
MPAALPTGTTSSQKLEETSPLGGEEKEATAGSGNVPPSKEESNFADQSGAGDVVDEPPNGGLRAWMAVFGGFFVFMASIGWIFAIGSFQAYYKTHQLKGKSEGAISWISSLEVFLLFFLSPFSVIIYRKIGARKAIAIGAIIHVFGLMMASLSKKEYQLVLAQGICSPIGAALAYHPATQTIPTWFKSKTPIAFGILTVGTALGGVIFPLMISRLINRIGFGWTMRAMAFMILGFLGIGFFTVEARTLGHAVPVGKDGLVAYSRNITLLFTVFATLISWLGYWVPFNYIGAYGLAKGMSFELAEDHIVIINAASCLGRLIIPALANRYGVFNGLIIVNMTMIALLFGAWIPANTNASIIAFSALFGFFAPLLCL